ncbi:MAG: hypothetical protein AAF773_27580 [Cyanobacteria bacterium P01_D01_bin.115]
MPEESSRLGTERLLRAWEQRIQAQVEATERTPLAYYAGGGRVQLLGGNNPYRPRGVQANTNLAIGDPVQLNGGLVAAMPGGGATLDLLGDIEKIDQSLVSIATSIGAQFGKGNPNEQDDGEGGETFIRPRRPFDVFHDLYTNRLWYWNSEVVEDAQWEVLRDVVSELNGAIDSIEANTYYPLILDSSENLRITKTFVSLATADGSSPSGSVSYELLTTDLGANPSLESITISLLGGVDVLRSGDNLWLHTLADAEGRWAFNIHFETLTDTYFADLIEA